MKEMAIYNHLYNLINNTKNMRIFKGFVVHTGNSSNEQ